MSAEIAASRAKLETVLARLEVAEKAAKERENHIQNQHLDIPRSNYRHGRKIQFDDSNEEEDHPESHHSHQGWAYFYLNIFGSFLKKIEKNAIQTRFSKSKILLQIFLKINPNKRTGLTPQSQ
jgi:hypothetical protein